MARDTDHDSTSLERRAATLAAGALILLFPTLGHRLVGLPVDTDIFGLYVTPALYLTDPPLVLLALVALRDLARRRPWRRPSWRPELALPLVGLVLIGLLSLPGAFSQGIAAHTVTRWALAALLYHAMVRGSIAPVHAGALLLLSLALQAGVGVAQVVVQQPLGLPLELALAPEVGGAAILPVEGARFLRGYGLTFHPNVLGGLLAAGLVATLPLVGHRWARGLWWLLVAGLVASFSRAALLAAAGMVPLAALLLARKRPGWRRGLAITLGGGLVVALLLGGLWWGAVAARVGAIQAGVEGGPVAREEARSLAERGALSAGALEAMRARPILGVGAGNFPLAMARLGYPALTQPAHNVTLLLSAEVGPAGGALWLLLGASAAAHVAARRSPVGDPWVVATLGGFLILFLISFVDFYPWALESGRLATATLLGLGARATAVREPDG